MFFAIIAILTRFCLNCACYFVASKGSKDCIYSHLIKRRIFSDPDSKFEREESFHVHCSWGKVRGGRWSCDLKGKRINCMYERECELTLDTILPLYQDQMSPSYISKGELSAKELNSCNCLQLRQAEVGWDSGHWWRFVTHRLKCPCTDSCCWQVPALSDSLDLKQK